MPSDKYLTQDTASEEAGAMVSYRQVRNTMFKRRQRLEIPGNPKHHQEFEDILMRTLFSNYFRSMVIIHEGAAAIFSSDLIKT